MVDLTGIWVQLLTNHECKLQEQLQTLLQDYSWKQIYFKNLYLTSLIFRPRMSPKYIDIYILYQKSLRNFSRASYLIINKYRCNKFEKIPAILFQMHLGLKQIRLRISIVVSSLQKSNMCSIAILIWDSIP